MIELRMKFAAFSPMPEPDLIELYIIPLNRLGIRYLVSGSVAAMYYGEPRLTYDIDLIVFLRAADLTQLSAAFSGPEFHMPIPDTILTEMARAHGGHFNIIHVGSGFKADFYPAGRDELHAWAFRNARVFPIGGNEIRIAPPEYVIVRKLEYFREGGSEKHLRDIQAMLSVSGEIIDRAVLMDLIQQRQLVSEWNRASVQP